MNKFNDPNFTTKTKQLFGSKVTILLFPNITDARGSLLPVDFEHLPFFPKRAFVVDKVPAGTIRAGHAQMSGMQLLLRLSGAIEIKLRLDGQEEIITLKNDGEAILIQAPVWVQTTYNEENSTLLLFSNEFYRPQK